MTANQTPTARRLSAATEDYLKAIYELQAVEGVAHTSAIAQALELAPPSVTGMVKRLEESGLLQHTPYKGAQLTTAGRRTALRLVRRHRILEVYLAAKLGYDWDSVHAEAELLEHAVSDELVERMALALGNPRYDPHGAPIPSKEGVVEEPVLIPLSEIPVGTMAELRQVSDRDAERLRYLARMGLRLGTVFEVVARQPFRGPVTVRVSATIARDQMVGHQLAESLGCVPRGREVG
jgi:DtxR family Mn-dependent transcriptional regulator